MGVFDDFGRLINAGAKTPRPKFADSIKQAADAAEGAQAYKDAATMAAQAGTGGYGANPFENLAMMNSAIAGSGVVKTITDTGKKLDTASIFDVALTVTIDGEPPFDVVHRQVIAAAALGGWQPGKVISLRVDPKDKTKVMLG